MTRRSEVAVVLFAVGFAFSSAAQEIRPHTPLWTAPPIAWASPLAGGPIRVQFVAPLDAGREVAALASRVELRAATAAFDPSDEASGRAALASALGEKFDVLVVCAFPANWWPDAEIERLGTALNGGLGAVFIDFEDSSGASSMLTERLKLGAGGADLLAGVGPEAMVLSGSSPVIAFSGTAGRAVSVSYPGHRPDGQCLAPATNGRFEFPTVYENYFSLAARAIRWSARREPQSAVAGLSHVNAPAPDAVDTPPQLPSQFIDQMKQSLNPTRLHSFELSLSAPAPKNYQLRVQLRYPGRGVQWLYDAQEIVRKGATTVPLAIPAGTGEYFIDVWLMDRLDVIDWYTQAITLDGRPRIADVRFAPSIAEPNDRMRVSLRIEGGSRNLVSTVTGATAQAPAHATVIARILDPLGRVGAMRSFPVPPGGETVQFDVPIADWQGPYGRAELFATDGYDENASWWLRQTASYAAADLYFRQPPGLGLVWIADAPGDAGHTARAARQRLALLGLDRVHTSAPASDALLAADGLRPIVELPAPGAFPCNVDLSEASREGSRLRTVALEHATLRPGLYTISVKSANLSDDPACASAFAEFLERQYGRIDQLNAGWHTAHADWNAAAVETEARQAQVDRLEFQSRMLEAYRSAVQAVVRKTDPEALVGLLGAGPSTGLRIVDAGPGEAAPGADARTEFAVLRAAMPAGDNAENRARWLPWHAALNAMHAVWTTDLDLESAAEQKNPDVLQVLADAIDDVRAGYDVLLRGAVRPSPQALIILPLPTEPSQSLEAWIQILESHQVAYEIAAEHALASLDPARFRLTVLPARGAIGNATSFWTAQTLERGGAVVLDGMDGEFRTRFPAYTAANAVRDGWVEFRSAGAGPALSIAAPVDLGSWRREDDDAFAAWLADAGIAAPPGLRLPLDFRGQVEDVRVGAGRVVAVLRSPEGKSTATVRFDAQKNEHLYAPLGDNPGPLSRASAFLAPGDAALFSVLPYEVTRVVVDVPESVDPGRRLEIVASVKTRGALPGLHVLHVQIFDPSGARLRLYDRTIIAQGGHGAAQVPLAYNEIPGRYRVVVREVLTGVETTVEVKVN